MLFVKRPEAHGALHKSPHVISPASEHGRQPEPRHAEDRHNGLAASETAGTQMSTPLRKNDCRPYTSFEAPLAVLGWYGIGGGVSTQGKPHWTSHTAAKVQMPHPNNSPRLHRDAFNQPKGI